MTDKDELLNKLAKMGSKMQFDNKKRELLRQLGDSIREEQAAINVYGRRARYALQVFPEIAELYEHVQKEEEHHAEEFYDMTQKLQKEEWNGD